MAYPVLTAESIRHRRRHWLRDDGRFSRLFLAAVVGGLVVVACCRYAPACEAGAPGPSIPAFAFEQCLPMPAGPHHLKYQLRRFGFVDVALAEPRDEPNADCMGGSYRFSADGACGCASYVGIVCYPTPASRWRGVRVDWWMVD